MKQMLIFSTMIILFVFSLQDVLKTQVSLIPPIWRESPNRFNYTKLFNFSKLKPFCPYGSYNLNGTRICRKRPYLDHSWKPWRPIWWLNKNETNCTKNKELTCRKFLNKTKCFCQSKFVIKPRNITRELKCKPGTVRRCTKGKCFCQKINAPILPETTYSCSEGYSITCFNSRKGERCYCKKNDSN